MAEVYHDQTNYGVVEIFWSEELGRGSYRAVYRARCDELVCAAKVLHHALFSEEGGERHPERQFDRECYFLSDLRHPNIVQYLGMHVEGNERVLLMELMDGNLTNYLEQNERNPLPYHTEIDISYDVALALAYLHAKFIIHRDLTSNNVLMVGDRRAKVCDFGMSKLISRQGWHQSSQTLCPGNPAYMPPEAIDESSSVPYSEKFDCFSYGVLCVQIMTRLFPKPSARLLRTDTAFLRSVVSEVSRRTEHIEMIDNEHPFKETILQCLKDSAEERPSAQELCHRLIRLKEGPRYIESIHHNNARALPIGRNFYEDRRREERIHDLEEQIQQSTLEKQELRQQIRTYRAEVTRKNREIEEKASTIAQFERKRLQQRHEVEELSSGLQEARSQLLRCEQQFQTDIMVLQENIREKEKTIATLSWLNDELQEELKSKKRLLDHQKSLSERISRLRLRTRYGEKAPCQLRREPDAIIFQNVVYFKYFWGKHIICYDINREVWSELPPCPNSSFSMATINGSLTIVGGKKPSLDPTNSLVSYVNSEWLEEFPAMPTNRYWTITVGHGTHTIVIGGETDYRTVLRTVEIFESKSRCWSTACSLPLPFDSATATIHSEQLFLAGGSSENTARCVLSCSLTCLLDSCRPAVSKSGFAPHKSEVWIRICDLPFYKATITTLGEYLVAVGGDKTGSHSPSSAVFVYDKMTGAWIEIGSLKRARSACFAVTLPRQEVMVVGGLGEGTEGTNSTEFLSFD